MRIQRIGMFAAPFLLLLLTRGTPTATDAKAWQVAKPALQVFWSEQARK